MIKFTIQNNCPYHIDDVVGVIPYWLYEDDEREASEQIDANYQHGGGWRPFKGFVMDFEDYSIKYPGDPKMKPWARAKFRDDLIFVYEAAWVAIVKPNKTFEISRID